MIITGANRANADRVPIKACSFIRNGFSDDWIEAFRHLDTKYKSLFCLHIVKLKLSSTSELVS